MPSPWLRRELRQLELEKAAAPSPKPSLAEAAGQFLHAQQNAPLSPYAIETQGIRFQDLDPADFMPRSYGPALFRVLPHGDAAWATGSYRIAPDGSLKLHHFAYDSSD